MDNQRLENLFARFGSSTLPFLAPRRQPPGPVTFDWTKQVLADRRILIVGEDVENGGRAFLSLSHAGARSRMVRRREQLATYFDELRPEIVVIDCDSTSMGDPATVRHLRGDQKTAALLIVGLSADPSRSQRTRLRAAGIDDLLAKPVDARLFALQLVETLARLE
jgi:two-component system, sensor histidine kinase and response regulator